MQGTLALLLLLPLVKDVTCLVNVTIFYETLCPDSQNLFTNQVSPALSRFGKEVYFDYIPYGKSRTYTKGSDDFSFLCHHGEHECTGNKWHACAKKLHQGRNEELTKYFVCTMPPYSRSVETFFKCAPGNDFALKSCAEGKEGRLLLNEMGKLSRAAYKQMNARNEMFQFVPTVFIDGEPRVKEALYNLPKAICDHARVKPLICGS